MRNLRSFSFSFAPFALLFVACGAPSIGDDGPLGTAEDAIQVCPGPSTVEGIDVSGYQPNTDWSQVATTNIKFAFIKATEGTTYTNPYFAQDWAGTKQNGIIRGAYHFFHSNDDPVAQANFFVQTVGALEAGDLPLMLDLEVTDGESASTVASTALTFLQSLEQQTGKRPVVYTGPSFFSSTLGEPAGFGIYPLFIANYGVSCPTTPPSWSTPTFWQDGDSASIAGVAGGCDHDIFYGSMDDLIAFAGGTVKPPTPLPAQINGNDAISVFTWAPDAHAAVFVTDASSKLLHASTNGATDDWSPLAAIDGDGAECGFATAYGETANASAYAFTPSAGKVLSASTDGTTWSALAAFDGTNLAHLSTLTYGDGHVDVFALGSDGAGWTASQGADGTFGAFASIGGAIATGIAPILWGDGHPEIFATDKNGTVWHNFTGGSSPNGWFGWLSINGTASSRPAVVRWSDGHIEAFVTMSDGHLGHSYYDQGQNKWIDLAGVATSSTIQGEPSAIMNGSDNGGGPEIFARDTSNKIVHAAWNGTDYGDLSALGDVIAISDPVAWLRDDGSAEVFVVDANHALNHAYRTGSTWSAWASLGGEGTIETCQPNDVPPTTTATATSAATGGDTTTSGAGGANATTTTTGASSTTGGAVADEPNLHDGCACDLSSSSSRRSGLTLALAMLSLASLRRRRRA